MTRKTKQKIKARASGTRRIGWWPGGLILLAVVAMVGYLTLDKPAAPEGPNPSKLVGRWLRPDGGYVLQLSDPGPNGELKAAYFNPRPINVWRAEWNHQAGYLGAFVELRDVNYPGSTYTLAYNPTQDRLVGIYFQAAMKQQFNVEFERIQ